MEVGNPLPHVGQHEPADLVRAALIEVDRLAPGRVVAAVEERRELAHIVPFGAQVVVDHVQQQPQAGGVAGVCQFEAINVFDWFKANTKVAPHERVIPRYDLIVLDPPSFTRNRSTVPDALRGYKELHLRALKLLKPGGVMATFCCSHHVDAGLFQDTVLAAAYDQRRVLRRVATYAQSPDHPILPSIPETEYLKGFAFELVR